MAITVEVHWESSYSRRIEKILSVTRELLVPLHFFGREYKKIILRQNIIDMGGESGYL